MMPPYTQLLIQMIVSMILLTAKDLGAMCTMLRDGVAEMTSLMKL